MSRLRAQRFAYTLAPPVLGILALAQAARGTAYQWNGSTSSWSTATNWTPNGVPAAGDTVTVSSAGSVSASVNYDYTGAAVALGGLTVDGANELITQAANNLSVTGPVTIGTTGTASFNQTGGTITITSAKLNLGYGGGGSTRPTGNFYLTGTAVLNANGPEVLGTLGNGNFLQTGGTNNAGSNAQSISLIVGSSSSSSTYNMTSGQLNVTGAEIIGWVNSSAGVFSQSGGTHTVNSPGILFDVGDAGSSGTYLLSKTGALSVNTEEAIGGDGAGVFNQSGGTNTITGASNLDIPYGGNGTYLLSAGTATVQNGGVYVGGSKYSTRGTGSLIVNGTGALTMSAALTAYNTSGTSINFSGGTITTASVNLSGVPSLLNWAGGTLDITGSGSSFAGAIPVPSTGVLKLDGAITDPVTISPGGLFDLDANTGTGILVRSLNTITISPNTGKGANGQVNAVAAVNHANRQLIVTTGLTIASSGGAWQGQFDLANNDIDIQAGNLATVTNEIKSGFANGTWTGTGIASTAAHADTAHLTALGVILNGSVYGTGSASLGLFDGTSPAATDVLVKYTYFGDANLDGKVDGSDYTLIDNGFNSQKTSMPLTGWYNGDFNYDGKIDGSDYTLIDNAFNRQGGNLSATISTQISTSSSVPEPAGFGMLAAAALVLFRSRRRVGTFAFDVIL